MKRQEFISTLFTGTCGLVLVQSCKMQAPATDTAKTSEKGPPLNAELVKNYVGKAHTDKDAVIRMLDETPTLLNAAWDWGGGDFETALGAASHVGYTELVNELVARGAQLNFLTLCLLGKTELVKQLLDFNPKLIDMKGPHGYTPLHHANKGGTDAAEVKKLLESRGAKETRVIPKWPVQK